MRVITTDLIWIDEQARERDGYRKKKKRKKIMGRTKGKRGSKIWPDKCTLSLLSGL